MDGWMEWWMMDRMMDGWMMEWWMDGWMWNRLTHSWALREKVFFCLFNDITSFQCWKASSSPLQSCHLCEHRASESSCWSVIGSCFFPLLRTLTSCTRPFETLQTSNQKLHSKCSFWGQILLISFFHRSVYYKPFSSRRNMWHLSLGISPTSQLCSSSNKLSLIIVST